MKFNCYICGKELEEGDKVTNLEEGYWCFNDVVDREIHYIVHTDCLFKAIKKIKED